VRRHNINSNSKTSLLTVSTLTVICHRLREGLFAAARTGVVVSHFSAFTYGFNSAMSADLQSWALTRLRRLLPIDDDSLEEIITYTSSLSKEAGAEHLKNLLGDSPQALEFISSFNARRADVPPPTPPQRLPETSSSTQTYDEGIPSPKKRAAKKAKPPLHSPGPVRRPEGYGDVSGGYQKRADGSEGSHITKQTPAVVPLSDHASSQEFPDAPLQQPQPSQHHLRTPSPNVSREPSPTAKNTQKLPPASGPLVTDWNLPNVRSKPSKKPGHGTSSQTQSGTSTPLRSSPTTTTSSIADLTAAIAALELSTNPTLSTERRKCSCNGSIHPLFATAPNCLNCGKIICALEGLQPCSFCDAPILTRDQVNSMIRTLKEERGVERMAVHNAGQSLSGRGTPIFGGSTPESVSGDEASSAAVRARAHRDKLLAFQRENAQRTRVYDEAADYDASLAPGTTQWMSPVQRAAALKKQQRYLRELEEANRPEWEKRKTVMSMSIKNGKLVKTYAREKAPTGTDRDDGAEDLEVDEEADVHELSAGTKGAFSRNPLLASGKFIRPIWKPQDTDGKGKGKGITADREMESTRTTQRSVWRRVQDDNEDNEEWILDGGLHGYDTET